jgi:predicted dienelactone hydrolase
MDPERIGVTGHSFGGYTSLAQAAGFGEDPPGELTDMLPEGFEPIPPDPRVRAIVPMAPVSWAFGDSELAAIDLPTLILGGTLDTTTPIDPESTRPFGLIPRRVVRVDVQRAVHFSFTNSCDLIQVLLDAGIPLCLIEWLLGRDFTEPCGPDVLAVEEVQRIANLYTLSHFHRFLNGDARYTTYLTEAYAGQSEPNVSFFSKE